MLGGRSFDMVRRNVGRRENWEQLRRMRQVYPAFLDNVRRYLTGAGDYPYEPEVRTPAGVVRPTLHSSHDLVTLNEMFCRLDYAAPDGLRTVVDIGSNIGISALYFLTRNADVHVHCYEPVPRNVERLRENLRGFEGRYTLTEAAVWDRAGTVTFGVEDSGRYGGIDVPTASSIEVPCLEVNAVLESVLEGTDRVDLLKVDTEGAEEATIAAIRPDLLDRVGLVYFETMERPRLHADRFETTFAVDTARMTPR